MTEAGTVVDPEVDVKPVVTAVGAVVEVAFCTFVDKVVAELAVGGAIVPLSIAV